MVGIAGAKRLTGDFAGVPTLVEQGIDTGLSSWRAIYGPKGIGAAHVAYWQDALGRMVGTEEWKKTLAARQWGPFYLTGEEASRYLEANYKVTRSIMIELGLVK
jgi:putative tricarboxylic transport membrane protein